MQQAHEYFFDPRNNSTGNVATATAAAVIGTPQRARRPSSAVITPSPGNVKKRKVNKKQRLSRMVGTSDEILNTFSKRKKEKGKHIRVLGPDGKIGSCVMCHVLCLVRKEQGEAFKWQKEVKRMPYICSCCSEFGEVLKCCFFCREYFDTFHNN